MSEGSPSLEEVLQRLEEIISKLDDDAGTLEEALSDYEEGIHLARECLSRLDVAETRVEELRRILQQDEDSADGTPF